jgi:hypothetical protein
MGPRRTHLVLLALLVLSTKAVFAEIPTASVDSDRDGLSDQLEQALLTQFAPKFFVGRQDCAGLPAQFTPGLREPIPAAEDGTIYGQVSPVKVAQDAKPLAEIHFYHLWDRDCGAHGHPLDTEHVAALVQASSTDLASATWTALYWYAAAHEDTVCDVSQIARASTVHAEDSGAQVWISPGKHASFLDEALCSRGCGADRCETMLPLHTSRIVNLGEVAHPMYGSVFIASNAWPLAEKMTHTNFSPAPLARLNTLPDTDIAWYSPGKHPAQGVIAVSYSTGEAIAGSGSDTDAAVSLAGDKTGNALQKSYRNTRHALGTSARHVGEALHLTSKPDTRQ